MPRLNNGAWSSAYRWGAGSGYGEEGRWVKFYNGSGADQFIPDNSTAEQQNAYSLAPVTRRYGDYGNSGYVYNNTAGFGSGPCWYGNSNSASYTTPGGCPSGYTDAGTVNGNNGNSNDYSSTGGDPHGNAYHMGYYVLGYGCPSGTYHKITIRYCRV